MKTWEWVVIGLVVVFGGYYLYSSYSTPVVGTTTGSTTGDSESTGGGMSTGGSSVGPPSFNPGISVGATPIAGTQLTSTPVPGSIPGTTVGLGRDGRALTFVSAQKNPGTASQALAAQYHTAPTSPVPPGYHAAPLATTEVDMPSLVHPILSGIHP